MNYTGENIVPIYLICQLQNLPKLSSKNKAVYETQIIW